MNKPKLTQKHGGWLCTDGSVVRWRETPEQAYEEYLKACKEVEEMLCRAKTHGAIAHIPLHKMSQADIGNIEAIDYTRPAYSSYDIYENAEEQDKKNEKILWCYVGVLGLIVVAMFVGIALS